MKETFKVVLLEKEWELMVKRITVPNTAPGELDRINYNLLEMDIIQVNPQYAIMTNYTDVENRSPHAILVGLLREVFKKYMTPEQFVASLPTTPQRKYVIESDILKRFTEIDPKISKENFADIMKLLDPRRVSSSKVPPKIFFEPLAEAIAAQTLPLVTEIVGRILNGFDKNREPFGIKVASKVKNKWIQNVALYGVLKEYNSNLTENESRLLVRYLNFNYESSDRVDYKEFTTAAFKLFEKMELRDRHVLQLFFSTIPLTTAGAVDEIPSDATGPFNKDRVAPRDNSAPVPISTALEATLTDFVLRIKQKYHILTKSDAETAFRRIDTNKNKVVSKVEFEAMAKECIPEATDSARNHLYRMFDRTNVGSFNVEQFVDVVIRQVPHHLDRMEILIDKTEQFSQVIKEIDEKLRRLKISLMDLFPGQKQVRKLMIVDKFDQYKVLDPTKRIPAMLDMLEVEQGGIRVINLEELDEIIKAHKPQQKTLNQMFDTSAILETGEQNYDFKGPDKSRIDQVIELIRKAISEKPEKAVYNLFKTVDKNGDNFIEFPEFFFMLKQIDKRIIEREAKVVFKRVDLNRTDTISQDEFIDFFGMRGFVENESLVERARRRDTRFDSILEDLTKGIAAKSTKPESVYVSPTDTFTRQSFDKSLKVFNVYQGKYANFADFIKVIQHKNNPDLIDLTKLKLMLYQYYQDNRNIITQDITSKADILLDQLLRMYQDIPLIVSTFDSDRNGFISLAEFTIFTKRILGPQSFTDIELEAVYKALKGDEKELMAYMFNLKLIEVQSKYNQNGPNMLGFGNLNSSMDMMLPGSPMMHPGLRPGMSMFDLEIAGGGEQSMLGMPLLSTEGMSSEEKHRAAINNVYVKIRDMIHYKEEELIDELKAIDKDSTNLLHSHYIWQALKKLGATESAFSDAEKKLMFEEVARSDERYYYLDFFRRVFPTKQLVNITNAKELADELIKQQQIRKETLSMLVHEAFAGNEAAEMTYPLFEKFLSARGLLLSEDTRDKIFGEFDVQFRRKISVDEFKLPFNKDGIEEAAKLENNLKFYLQSLGKTTVDAFAPFTPKSKDFDFKDFATTLAGINFPIKYIEIETLFEKLGGSQITRVTLDHMASILDQPIPPKVETIDSTLIRRSMYKEIKAKYHGFQHFFETFDSNDKKYLSLADFGQMLNAIGITFTDLKADVRPMYEAINIDKNYRLSQRELYMFYDENTILILFPVITQFRTAFLNYINTKMEPAYFIIAQHSNDPTAGLGLKEFQDLLKTIGLTADDDQAALIFNELDYSGDKMVTPAELRRCLSNVIIDVVGLSETISTTLYRRGIDTRVAFTSANINADDGLNFAEFYDLVVNKLKLNLNIVEVEELFDFAHTGNNKKVTVSDFVNLFSSTRKVNPFLHNKKYMEHLPEESRKYYLEKYRTLINAKGNLKGFNREADRHLLEVRRRSGYPAMESGFALEKLEGGDQSMPMVPGTVGQPSQGQITEIDQMFGERLKTKKKADEIEQTYKAAISDNFKSTMSPEDLQGLLRDLNMFPKKQEVEAMYKRIQSYAKEPLEPINLDTFITYAKTVLEYNGRMKENGVNLVGIAGPALKKYLLFERILPEEHYRRYKARSTEGLLGHEFQKMIDDLKLPLEPTYDETMKLFHFLCRQRDDEILTYNDFLNIFEKPEEIIVEINKIRHEGLLFELKIHCNKFGADNCVRAFTNLDLQMSNEIETSSFKYFFKKNYIMSNEDKLNELCSIFQGSTPNKVNYINFLEACELMDHATAQSYLMKTHKPTEQHFAEEFASYVELYCNKENLPIDKIFDLYVRPGTEKMTYTSFRDLAQKVNVDEAYNDIQIEKLFSYIDSNGTDEVTRDEFYKVIFPKQYAEIIGNVYAKYIPDFEQIKTALKHQRRANLKEFFKTDKNIVTFELFMKSSSFLDFDPRSQRVFELMSVFEDNEKPHNINIEKVKSV